MRNIDNNMRIINPYTRVVWITNPDNIKEIITGFFRICNPKVLNISICNAEKSYKCGL